MQRWDRLPFQDTWPFSALWGKETPLGILGREQSCHGEAQSYMAYLVLCLFLFSLSKYLQGFFFPPHLKNYYATASCWDYTNKLIIAKQYAAPCSNITARQQSSPRCQLPFTACKQKRHKWRPPTLPASGGTELLAMWSQGGVSLFPCQCTLCTVRACKVMLSSKATQRNPDAPLPWRGLAPWWVLIGQMGLLVTNKLAILNDNLKSFISRMFMCTLCTWTGISYKLLGCDTPPENRNLAFRAYR